MTAISTIDGVESPEVVRRGLPSTDLHAVFAEFYRAGWGAADSGIGHALLAAVRRGGTRVDPEDQREWCVALGDAYLDYCIHQWLGTGATDEDL
jgi:hypothetical protein